MIALEQLKNIMPKAGSAAEKFLQPLNDAMARFDINSPAREAAFLAQLAHESGQLKTLVENLNYGAPGLLAIFSRYFTPDQAKSYERQPAKIANRAYANRIGNGNEASGDGWRYRGRGPIQLTGRANYRACGAAIGMDIEANPDLVQEPVAGALAAAWFWSVNKLNALADANTVKSCGAISAKVNGKNPAHGLSERLAFWKSGCVALGIDALESLPRGAAPMTAARPKAQPVKPTATKGKAAKSRTAKSKPAKSKPAKAAVARRNVASSKSVKAKSTKAKPSKRAARKSVTERTSAPTRAAKKTKR
ncbi:MAG: glycoside hydrolase family 19 protein [Burkholderiales bacterium]